MFHKLPSYYRAARFSGEALRVLPLLPTQGIGGAVNVEGDRYSIEILWKWNTGHDFYMPSVGIFTASVNA